MLNVLLPLELDGPRRVCTVFDVIPARLPETHQAAWTERQRCEYRRRLSALADWADSLVFISQAAREDFADLFPNAEAVSCSVPLAVDHGLFWPSAAIARAPAPSYVMCVGGGDPRKNSERAIEAFGKVVSGAKPVAGLELRIVGDHDPASCRRLRDLARKHGVSDRVVLTGQISDRALSRAYREASALLFPSLYEGFGLPVLEALACGLPIVAADRPELRECASEFASYCDPLDPADIADQLREILRDPAKARSRARAGIEHARGYTWERTADAYATLLDRVTAPRQGALARPRPKVAWVSPWLPDRSGVAAYSREVVAHLVEHVDLEIFVERPRQAEPISDIPIQSLALLDDRRSEFDEVAYHLGNNARFHDAIYREAWRNPGVVVLHDFNLHSFLETAYLGSPDEELYRLALEESHGEAGSREFARVASDKREPRIFDFPASRAIALRSRATIVHSDWIRESLGDVDNVEVIPHGVSIRPPLVPSDRAAARVRIGIDERHLVVGAFGFLNSHKRIPSLLEACARLHHDGHLLTLLLVGAVNDKRLELDQLLESHDAASFTTVTGFVEEASYWRHLDACDVVVNLRYPTMGESSGSLMRAIGSGAACITSDHGPFAELPDAACWKVATDGAEVDELEACLGALLRDPELRTQLGGWAGQWADAHLRYERTAAGYAAVLRESAERARLQR